MGAVAAVLLIVAAAVAYKSLAGNPASDFREAVAQAKQEQQAKPETPADAGSGQVDVGGDQNAEKAAPAEGDQAEQAPKESPQEARTKIFRKAAKKKGFIDSGGGG